MASGVVFSFRPPAIRPCAATGNRPDSGRRAGDAKWWAPLFAWPAEPDYIDGGSPATEEEAEKATKTKTRRQAAAAAAARRYGAFTEEKARELRMRLMETESFHDAMYHSAIASRLASGRPPRRSGVSAGDAVDQ